MKMDKVVCCGIGNAGGQVSALAQKKYPELFTSIFINTSEADLSQVNVDTDLKFKIGERDIIEGSAKNRARMKEYLKEDLEKLLMDEKFQSAIVDSKYCFIISSTAGGTGSGAAPVLLEILSKWMPKTKFILVAILPRIEASLMEQGNSLEYLNELYEVIGDDVTYMIYDNESTADLSPTQSLQEVNKNIVEDLRVLTGVDNYSTPYESIDAADLESILTTKGRLLVARVKKDLSEKNIEDNSIDDMIIKAIKQSSNAETDRDKKVERWGIITYLTESANEVFKSNFERLSNFVGTPLERFNHNAINPGKDNTNFLYFIASGMAPINDRTQKVIDRIEELKNAQANSDSMKFILSGEGASYNDIMERRKEDERSRATQDFDPDSIFDKFM